MGPATVVNDEYAAEEFTLTPTVCGEKNDNSIPFGMLPDKLSWPIMGSEQITFFPPTSLEAHLGAVGQWFSQQRNANTLFIQLSRDYCSITEKVPNKDYSMAHQQNHN